MKDFRGQNDKNANEKSHSGTLPASMTRDEAYVQMLVNFVENHMTNPFDVDSHPVMLINISTGMHATVEVQTSLLNAVGNGQKSMEKFVQETLSVDHEKSFYSAITRSGLKTFENMTTKTNVKRKDITVNVTVNPEVIFRKALALTDCWEDINTETVLNHTVGSVPTSIFHPDGTMRKTNKAELGHKLEALTERVISLPDTVDKNTTELIRDSMNIIQIMSGNTYAFFEDMAVEYVKHILYMTFVVPIH